jgi:tRNA dimethylallyltransferase
VLNDEREHIYRRIERRVDEMIECGLVDEVERLRDLGCRRDMVSMQGLGYKEILDYLNGDISLDEAIYIIKRETRHFAKRQITWFKRERDVIWINKTEYAYDENAMLDEMLDVLKGRDII